MNLEFSRKLNSFEAGIFAILNEKKEKLVQEGRTVYNFSVGTPDFKPEVHIMKALEEAARKPENYKYALVDLPELLDAVSSFYKQRFGVMLRREEIMSLYGSQEGMAHLALALCDPGDIVLVPNPGYPIFSIGPMIGGCEIVGYPLYEENQFLPKLEDIDKEVARKAKFMVVSYPANPVSVTAPDCFYEELIAFAKENNIMILHDNAYSDIVYGGMQGKSFLSFEGAMEVGIEFYSLSKSYNLTGARISFAIGNEEIIRHFRQLRSQIDYGIFLPVQYAAIAALTGPQDAVKRQCALYEKRNKVLCSGLREIGWDIIESTGTMFVWAKLPKGYTNSEEFVIELMEKTGVIVVSGSSFGTLGEGYVRFALVLEEEKIQEAIIAIKNAKIIKNNVTTK